MEQTKAQPNQQKRSRIAISLRLLQLQQRTILWGTIYIHILLSMYRRRGMEGYFPAAGSAANVVMSPAPIRQQLPLHVVTPESDSFPPPLSLFRPRMNWHEAYVIFHSDSSFWFKLRLNERERDREREKAIFFDVLACFKCFKTSRVWQVQLFRVV